MWDVISAKQLRGQVVKAFTGSNLQVLKYHKNNTLLCTVIYITLNTRLLKPQSCDRQIYLKGTADWLCDDEKMNSIDCR